MSGLDFSSIGSDIASSTDSIDTGLIDANTGGDGSSISGGSSILDSLGKAAGPLANAGLAASNLLGGQSNPLFQLINQANNQFAGASQNFVGATTPYTNIALSVASTPVGFPISQPLTQLSSNVDTLNSIAANTRDVTSADMGWANQFPGQVTSIANQILPIADKIGGVGDLQLGQGKQQYDLGSQLQSYLTSGNLPPAQQAAIDQAIRTNTAGLLGAYGTSGAGGLYGGSPSSTGLATDIGSLNLNALAQKGQIEGQDFTLGTGAVNAGTALESAAATDYGLQANTMGQAIQGIATGDNLDIANLNAVLAGNTAASGETTQAANVSNLGLQDILSAFTQGSTIGLQPPTTSFTQTTNWLADQLKASEAAAQSASSASSSAAGGLGSAIGSIAPIAMSALAMM